MSDDVEFNRCSTCGKTGGVIRKYYYYDIHCDCCNGETHFEIVRHHYDCEPSPPPAIKLVVEMKPNE